MTEQQHPIAEAKAPVAASRRALGWLLAAAALLYIGHYIHSQRVLVADAVLRMRLADLLFALLLAIAMVALKTVYHALALWRLWGESSQPWPRFARIARAYAGSQVVRYLPGKVLGVVYEANALSGEVALHRIVIATLVQYLYTTALSVAVLAAVVVWIAWQNLAAALAIVSLSVAALWVGHRWHLAERVLARLAMIIPRLRNIPAVDGAGSRLALAASLVLMLEWIPFYGYWWALLPAGDAEIAKAIVIGTCYAGAALIANLAVVMPSGLVIREALFLWIGTQASVDAASLVVLGVLSRVLFTLADLTLAPLALLANAVPRHRSDE